MKRSEMLKNLKNHTDKWISSKPTLIELDLILGLLEDYGILPPYKDGEEPFGWNEGYIEYPKWEEEPASDSESDEVSTKEKL